MQSRVNFGKSQSSYLIFGHAFRRYKANKYHPGSKTNPLSSVVLLALNFPNFSSLSKHTKVLYNDLANF